MLYALSIKELDYLKKSVEEGKNILVCGGTGTGKTTILNSLIDFIPEEKTLAVLGFSPATESQSDRKHVIHFESENEELGAVITFLLAQERPHFLTFDEISNNGFFELAMGMGYGDKTLMMGMYGKSHSDALNRFVIQAIEQKKHLISDLEIKKSIGKGLDLIVLLERLSDGRRIATMVEVVEFEKETGVFILKNVTF